jgi:hypothetical protein
MASRRRAGSGLIAIAFPGLICAQCWTAVSPRARFQAERHDHDGVDRAAVAGGLSSAVTRDSIAEMSGPDGLDRGFAVADRVHDVEGCRKDRPDLRQDAGVVVGKYDTGQRHCLNLHTGQARGTEPT